jgi:hypothetical protein
MPEYAACQGEKEDGRRTRPQRKGTRGHRSTLQRQLQHKEVGCQEQNSPEQQVVNSPVREPA